MGKGAVHITQMHELSGTAVRSLQHNVIFDHADQEADIIVISWRARRLICLDNTDLNRGGLLGFWPKLPKGCSSVTPCGLSGMEATLSGGFLDRSSAVLPCQRNEVCLLSHIRLGRRVGRSMTQEIVPVLGSCCELVLV